MLSLRIIPHLKMGWCFSTSVEITIFRFFLLIKLNELDLDMRLFNLNSTENTIFFFWTYDRTCSDDTVFICFLPCTQIWRIIFGFESNGVSLVCTKNRMINAVRNQFSIWNELFRMCKGMIHCMSAMCTDERKTTENKASDNLVSGKNSNGRGEEARSHQNQWIWTFIYHTNDVVTLRWL